ncbi:hypothetical protein K3M67_05535 [Sphingobium sp. V4]|uniref:DUF7065 domain-containing protein n=1 Tax=Sphingobium sp. V4 TaxID=3038927 RepID=UPI002557CE15|nr:hypothetical protein [Sphingobium sp. V4]WIW89431.1 hypothetical protein K3M67_05535 [Sphingobium sp. V4]
MSLIVTLPNGDPICQFVLADEALHIPGPEENWQESVAMWCSDLAGQANLFMRVGREPHMDGGNNTLWAFMQTPDCVYARNEQFPLRPGDIGDAHITSGGVGGYEFDGQGTHWWVKDEDVSWDVWLTPYHQPIPLFPAHNSDYVRTVGSAHFEAADRMEGTIRVKGETRQIRGFSYRDHSWGPRNWSDIRCHRWTSGVFEDDISFAFSNFLTQSSGISRRGYIRKGSVVHYTQKVDVIPYMEGDGFSHRGGLIIATLEDGTTHRIELDLYAEDSLGNVSLKRDSAMIDTPCQARLDGRLGYAILEVGENPRRGTNLIDYVERGLFGSGLLRWKGQDLGSHIR